MKIQTITLDDFHRYFGTLDTNRALHCFTKPLDTNIVLTLLIRTHPQRILEIGTALGHMSANLAEWSPASAQVFTVGTTQDLPSTGPLQQRCESPSRNEIGCFSNYFSKGDKLVIITADSLVYDFRQLSPIDFAFIDGAHDFNHVFCDSLKVYQELSPRGCIVWHDFESPVAWVEVRKALEQLALPETLIHVAGTEVAFLLRQGGQAVSCGLKEQQVAAIAESVSPHQAVRESNALRQVMIGSDGAPPKPLTLVWEGPFSSAHSFARINRAICPRLLARGHQLSILPCELGENDTNPQPPQSLLAMHSQSYPAHPDVLISHRWPPRFVPPPGVRWIVMQPWGYGSLPVTWRHAMNEHADAVCVPSSYVRDCYLRSGVVGERLHVVPLGVDPACFHPDAPPRTLRNRKSFRFLFVGGTIYRKGIDVLLDAYRRAFTADDDVCLIIKDSGTRSFYQGQTAQQRLVQWGHDRHAPAIEYLDADWADNELPGLYTACDCLVAPYRGEGFGLPIVEALACGRPVIVTGHGAALDFCNNDHAYLIPAREVSLPERYMGRWETVAQPWLAEPDRKALIELLRHVANHVQEARDKGQTGASFIRQHFTWDHTVRRFEELLTQIARQPARYTCRLAMSVRERPSRSIKHPRVSLTMIVKNEAATLDYCLASVQDLVDEIIVVDTRSSDGTQDIARQHGARVFDLPWPDSFAAARNESLRHASGRWILWLDADEYLDETNSDKLRQLLEGLPDDNTAYIMRQRSPSANGSTALVGQVRLFRNLPDLRWDYRVHEQILPILTTAGHALRDTDVVIEHSGYLDPALRQNKVERNLRLLRLDLAERPNDPFTLFNLGWAYTDIGRWADAIPLLQRSLEHLHSDEPIIPTLYSLLTECYLRLGQHSEAWAACQAGHVRCPVDAELLFLKGQLCHERGDRTAARACWTQLLKLRSPTVKSSSPDDYRSETIATPTGNGLFQYVNASLCGPLVLHHLAILDREEGQFADAETNWNTALAVSPSFLPARICLAELYSQQSRWNELEPLLAELEPHIPLDATTFRARMELGRGEFVAARCLLEDVIAQAPQSVPPRLYLTHVLLQEGRDPAATEQALRQLLALDPSQGDAWHNLASLLRRQGRLAEAITVCQSACVYLPNHPDVLLLHGMLLHQAGDLVNAETILHKLLEQQTPSTPIAGSELSSSEESSGKALQWEVTARHNLGLIYRRQGKLAEAESQWQAAVSAMPDTHAAWIGLGELCLMQGRIVEVESILAHLEDRLPEDEAVILLRSRWHWQRREYRRARQLLERIIAGNPTSCEPRRLLTYVLLEEDRDRGAAERALHDLLDMAPDDAEARHNLAVLHYKQRLTG